MIKMVQFKTSHLFEALQLAEITSLNNYLSFSWIHKNNIGNKS